MTDQTIIMTWPDHAKLTELVERHRYKKEEYDSDAVKRLAAELAKATLVASEDIPTDVITMNSTVRVRDLDSSEVMTFALAWPDTASSANGHINVLAPLGMALLGSRVGENVEWPVPDGVRRLSVEKVLYQPERESKAKA